MPHPSVRRLQGHIRKLNHAEREVKKDVRELRKDQRELKSDRKELKRHRDVFEKHHKSLTKDRKVLGELRATEQKKLDALAAQKTILEKEYAATVDPATGLGDPAIKAEIDAVEQKEAAVNARFDPKIDARKESVDRLVKAVHADRKELQGDRKEIKQDRREIKQDRRELGRDRSRVKHQRKEGREDLRPAQFHMGLKQTNRARKELGLKPVDHVIRPMNLNTVKGCAQFLLKSKNVSFWSGLSTGSDRKNVERLANGGKAFVPARGIWVTPKLSLMKALVDMAKHGRIQINALTGGVHSSNSNHYRGTAVDLDIRVGSPSQIAAIANKYGGFRNSETTHIHLDF